MIITNNPMTAENLADCVFYKDATTRDIMIIVRDEIHSGRTLLSHPLSGSIKPNAAPYKSIAVSNDRSGLDFQSLTLIEDSIATLDKLAGNFLATEWSEKIRNDFMLIDFDLIR